MPVVTGAIPKPYYVRQNPLGLALVPYTLFNRSNVIKGTTPLLRLKCNAVVRALDSTVLLVELNTPLSNDWVSVATTLLPVGVGLLYIQPRQP